MTSSGRVAALLAVLMACSPPPPATTSPTPKAVEQSTRQGTFAPSPVPLAFLPHGGAAKVGGGCGATQAYRGEVPYTLDIATGSNSPRVPYVIAEPPIAAGFLFSYPLRAGMGQKILWVVGTPRGGPLSVTARPLGSAQPVVSATFPANSSPGEIYPSGVEVPTPGCWEFTLEWAGLGPHRAVVALEFD